MKNIRNSGLLLLALLAIFTIGLPMRVHPAQFPLPKGPWSERPANQAHVTLNEAATNVSKLHAIINTQLSTASPEAQDKANQIKTLATPTEGGPVLAADTDKARLFSDISSFQTHVSSENNKFTAWAVTFIIASAVFALFATIMGFMKKALAAGILGALVTTIIGISNAYPLNALSAFYNGLQTQVAALRLDCELRVPFTVDAYNSAATQLKILILAESKRPGFGSYKGSLEDATTEIQSVKTTSSVLEQVRASTKPN